MTLLPNYFFLEGGVDHCQGAKEYIDCCHFITITCHFITMVLSLHYHGADLKVMSLLA